MRAILCLSAVVFLVSCDASKQQLATTQSALSDVTKERDDLKAKVSSLQQDLDNTKAELAKAKAEKPQSSTMATKTSETKSGAGDTQAKGAPKGKHGHKS